MMVDVSKLAVGDSVVVEGSLSPAMGYLKRGEQAEVAFSETVADLHRKGFIVVKGKAGEVPPAQGTDQIVPTVPPVSFEKPDQTVPTVPSVKPDQTVPTVPNSGTNQDLVDASPVQGTDNVVPEVANPEVDNSLVDANATDAKSAAAAKASTTSTNRK